MYHDLIWIDEWAEIRAFDLLIRVISRLASRLFVGPELCRDERWLATSRQYTENAFKTIIFLRVFPQWMRPFVSVPLIYSWKVLYHLHNARKLLIPLVLQRREAKARGEHQADLKFTNLLEIMDEEAKGADQDPDKLVRRTLVLTLASSHTTSMAACQALFELCLRPEYTKPLRDEVQSVLAEDGGWRKTTLTKLKKLDSFMKESQRFHPPSRRTLYVILIENAILTNVARLVGFKRNILQELTLPNGQVLPRGAHTLLPIEPHAFEDPKLKDPDAFDGLRYYKMRQQQQEYANKLQFATVDKYNLHFGLGKHACPGRFLASNTIKMILGQLLLEYDFRFPRGQGRPHDVSAHEYIFPNPDGLIELRKRGNSK